MSGRDALGMKYFMKAGRTFFGGSEKCGLDNREAPIEMIVW